MHLRLGGGGKRLCLSAVQLGGCLCKRSLMLLSHAPPLGHLGRDGGRQQTARGAYLSICFLLVAAQTM